jgi:PEP-CTERM motif
MSPITFMENPMSVQSRALLGACVLAATLPVQAELLGRNLGGGAEFEAFYSTVLDLTFLADAGGDAPRASWDEAKAWAAALNVYGVTGWRLPIATVIGSGANAFQISGTNELAALNSIVLGHAPNDPLVAGPFSNFATSEGPYWIDADPTEDIGDTGDYAWHYVMLDHFSGRHFKSEPGFHAWAVKSGDVAAVPEPATYALMIAGVAVVGAVARRRKPSCPTCP